MPYQATSQTAHMPQPDNNGKVHLRVTWPGVWMFWDTKITLSVGRHAMGTFSFRKPFDTTIDVPAKCVLKVSYATLFGPRNISIDAAPGSSLLCRLNYSRFLGFMFADLSK